MWRFADLRSSLPVTRITRSSVSRLYSTKDEKLNDHRLNDRAETDTETDTTGHGEQRDDDYGFGNWSELNPGEKTIETAVGSLPISPLLDPSWRQARQRKKTKRPADNKGQNRFRRRMEENPYAQLLATSVRSCHITRTRLPRAFIQDFGLVKHPETGDLWWIPADFDQAPGITAPKVLGEGEPESPAAHHHDGPASTETPSDDVPATANAQDSAQAGDSEQTAAADAAAAAVDHIASQSEPATKQRGKFFAPAHVLARQDIMLEFQDKNSKYSSAYLKFAMIPSIGKLAGAATWRQDMDKVILNHMRRHITRELIYLSKLCESDGRDYLIRMGNDEDLKRYWFRNCYLSLGEGRHEPFDTLEIEGVDGSARPVYDLPKLLGSECMENLTSEASLFQNVPIVLLKARRTNELNKKLWRLQGFVAEYAGLT